MDLSKLITADDFLNLSDEGMKSLDPDERVVFESIIHELADEGESKTLKDLWMEDYEEIPTDIDTFVDDPEFLGGTVGDSIYPYWRDVLKKAFSPGANVDEIVLSGSIGIGKTFIACVGLAYILHRLLCLRNPQRYYGLNDTSKLVVAFFSVTLQQAYGTAYDRFQKMTTNSPWFLKHGQVVGDDPNKLTYIPDKNISIIVGSSPEHVIGYDVFCMSGDTSVNTELGMKSLDELSNDNNLTKLYSYDGESEILSNYTNVEKTKEVTELIEFTLEDGSSIKCTPDHRILVNKNDKLTYVQAKDINEQDDLVNAL